MFKKCLGSFSLSNIAFGLYTTKDKNVDKRTKRHGVRVFQVGKLILLIVKASKKKQQFKIR